MTEVLPPAKNPCGTCPYRKDVPFGVWAREEYEKLPRYDGATFTQPMGLFLCHQQDGRICAGWCGTHDMEENLAIRMHAREMPEEVWTAVLDYSTEVPLWESGQAAHDHGIAEVDAPSPTARRKIDTLRARRGD
jgi:Family of unknown function (DUF6283)